MRKSYFWSFSNARNGFPPLVYAVKDTGLVLRPPLCRLSGLVLYLYVSVCGPSRLGPGAAVAVPGARP